MIKFSTINFKSNYTTNLKNTTNPNFTNNSIISFRQYDFFEKGMSENEKKSTSLKDSQYKFFENENNAKSETNKTNFQNYKEMGYVPASSNTNLADGLAMAGWLAVPFILSVALAAAVAKGSESPEDIFLPDGSYFCNVKELSVKSSKLDADGDDGILKIKGTGINIDKSRYAENLSVPEKGIFKSADGKLDIDLLNNKYVDKDNGIIIDPDDKISAFMTVDGSYKQMPLVNFGGAWSSGHSSAMPTDDEYRMIEDVCKRIKENEFHDKWNGILDKYSETVSDVNSTNETIEKSAEFNKYIKENNITPDAATDIVDYANGIRLKEYMLDNYPDLAEKVNLESIDSFLQNIHSQGADFDAANGLIDIVNNDDMTVGI